MQDDRRKTTGTSPAELLAAAAQMPGVADLMALYEQHARVVAAANMYMVQPRPQGTLSAGTASPGLTS
jgi:hypothetical protein